MIVNILIYKGSLKTTAIAHHKKIIFYKRNDM